VLYNQWRRDFIDDLYISCGTGIPACHKIINLRTGKDAHSTKAKNDFINISGLTHENLETWFLR
jgi:hypothetical protein